MADVDDLAQIIFDALAECDVTHPSASAFAARKVLARNYVIPKRVPDEHV